MVGEVGSPEAAIGVLYQQAAQVLGSTSGQPSNEHVARAYQTLATVAERGDQLSLGLFPVAVALLILHENFQASTGEGRFRVANVIGRSLVIVIFIHPWTYGRLCALITFAAGGHGGWIAGEQVLGAVSKSVDGLARAWADYAGDDPGITDSVSALLRILPLIGLWLVMVCCLLLAYVAGALLSVSQAVILSILLAVGKTCIVATLVPGVKLGASWARSLAKVAAWSTVAAIITGLMVHAMPDLAEMVRAMSYVRILRTAGQFVVLAICTFAVPVITEKIFAGAAPAGNAALQAVTKGWHGLQAVGRATRSSTSERHERREGSPPGSTPRGGSGGGETVRPHKIAPSRLQEGLAMAGGPAGGTALAAAAPAGRVFKSSSTRKPWVTSGQNPRSRSHVAEATKLQARPTAVGPSATGRVQDGVRPVAVPPGAASSPSERERMARKHQPDEANGMDSRRERHCEQATTVEASPEPARVAAGHAAAASSGPSANAAPLPEPRVAGVELSVKQAAPTSIQRVETAVQPGREAPVSAERLASKAVAPEPESRQPAVPNAPKMERPARAVPPPIPADAPPRSMRKEA